jgi:hypothetical protein
MKNLALRNETIAVKELKNSFTTVSFINNLGTVSKASITKNVIKNKGFKKVIGLKLTEEINPKAGKKWGFEGKIEKDTILYQSWVFE